LEAGVGARAVHGPRGAAGTSPGDDAGPIWWLGAAFLCEGPLDLKRCGHLVVGQRPPTPIFT